MVPGHYNSMFKMKQKIFSKPGIITSVIVLSVAVLLISPDAKAFLINNLKNIGLIKAETGITQTGSQPGVAPAEPLPAPSSEEAPLAPPVVFKDGAGKTIDISKQKGKVIFINFWATWCPPCVAEMPSIDKLKAELHNENMLFLMVDVDDNYKKSSRFMASNKYSLPVYTPASEIPESLLSGAIPTTIIIDKEGRVIGRHEGAGDYSRPEVIKFFRDLLSK